MHNGMLYVPEPMIVDESTEGMEELPSFDEIDRMSLLECGFSEDSPRFRMIMEEVVADSEEERLFTIDTYRTCNFEDTADEILKNEIFDRYWHDSIHDLLDPDADATLVEQWTPEFMAEEVRKFLSNLKKGETFYYIEFFREILSKSQNDEAVNLIDFNDDIFEKMPKVTRKF